MPFDTLNACLLQAHILGFPTEEGQFILGTDASLFAVGGVLNQLQEDREIVIAYANRSLRLSQCRCCTTRRKMLVAVSMCTHFCSYLRGAQFALIIARSCDSRRSGTVMACWPDGICCSASYQLCSSTDRELSTLMQMAFLVNAVSVCNRIARCHRRKGTPVTPDRRRHCWTNHSSAMGDYMDAYLLPELSGETWVTAAYLDEITADLPPAGSEPDIIAAFGIDKTLQTVREWVQLGLALSWLDCAGLSPELRSWQ